MVLQCVIVEYEDPDSSHTNIKARIMLSDGIFAAMAILHPNMEIKNKQGQPQIIHKNDIVSVRKCTTKFVQKGNEETQQAQHPIIIFLEPIEVIYTNIDIRIGQPKEFTLDNGLDT